MTKKWHQYVAIRAAIILAVGGIIVAGINIWHARSELKQNNEEYIDEIKNKDALISELYRQLSQKDSEIQRMETQLTPFRTIALEKYTGSEQEALKKLADELEELRNADLSILLKLRNIEDTVGTIQQASTVSTTKRVISGAVAKRLTSSLKDITDYDVEILCVMGDVEGFALADQIKQIFSRANWKVTGVLQSIFRKPITGLIFEFGTPPPAALQRALFPFFDNLGYPREAYLNPKVLGNRVKIIVGVK